MRSGLDIAQAMVREFHERYGFTRDVLFSPEVLDAVQEDGLSWVRGKLADAENLLKKIHDYKPDERVWRLRLIIGEARELVEAILDDDEVSAAHESTDLLYVILGCFVAFNWPSERMFDNIHRANMTKRSDYKDAYERDQVDRHAIKGNEYEPPNIEFILESHRL